MVHCFESILSLVLVGCDFIERSDRLITVILLGLRVSSVKTKRQSNLQTFNIYLSLSFLQLCFVPSLSLVFLFCVSVRVSLHLLCQVMFSFSSFVSVHPKQSLFQMRCLKVETREFWWDEQDMIRVFKLWKVDLSCLVSIYLDCRSKLSVIFSTSSIEVLSTSHQSSIVIFFSLYLDIQTFMDTTFLSLSKVFKHFFSCQVNDVGDTY